jgi:ankyrin repeat protein
MYGEVGVVEMPLAAGADPAARDNVGRSALDFAEEHDRRKVITLLRGLTSSLARP